MVPSPKRLLARLGLGAMLAAMAALPGYVFAAGVTGSGVSGTLTASNDWAAYAFSYPGDQSDVEVTLTYTLHDASGDGDVTFDAFAPTGMPGSGAAPVGGGSVDTPGVKTWELSSDSSGNYVVIIHNWDPAGAPVAFTLSTTDMDTGQAGPDLSFVSSAATSFPPAPLAPAPVVAPPQGSSAIGGLLQAATWKAYALTYAGDESDVQLTLTYSPADPMSDQATTLEVFSPDNLPPQSGPLAAAGQGDRPGIKTWDLVSDTGGTYVVIVHNWDPSGRDISFNLTTTDVADGTGGPVLTLVSSGM